MFTRHNFYSLAMMFYTNSTAHGRREVGRKIGHSRCEVGCSETMEVGNDEHPVLPAASSLEFPSVSCLLSGVVIESRLDSPSGSRKMSGQELEVEASGSKEVGQCLVCKVCAVHGLRVHHAKTECGVAVESSTREYVVALTQQSGNPLRELSSLSLRLLVMHGCRGNVRMR